MKTIVFNSDPVDEDGEYFDGVEIRIENEDGVVESAWQENSWGYIDQWLRFSAPKDEPVTLRVEP